MTRTESHAAATRRPHVVVVGGGAAGLVLADRLADTARVTIVEAGPDAGSPLPGWLLDDITLPDELFWNHLDADTGRIVLRGKVTGGCTSINAAAALRGQPWDFDEWGVPGWGWADLEPSFAAIEADEDFGDRPGHGADGPLPIRRLSFSPIDDAFARWADERGHAWVEDQNAPGALGVGHWPTNMIGNGRRWGAHAAYMAGLRDRIELVTSTTVRRLRLVDGVCTGVEVVGPDGAAVIDADHVVLAAGAVGSPAILLRSGVGPRALLESVGVDTVVDRPAVGADLQDHPWATLQVAGTDPDAAGQRPVNGSLLRYEVSADGVPAGDHVEVHLYPHQARPYVPDADPRDVLVGIGLMRAHSRGSVGIDAVGEPVIRLGHLAEPADRAAFTAVLHDAAAYVDDMVAAGVFLEPSDPWWRADDPLAAAEERLESYGHLVGTCRMGTDDDAVVDETLAVRGLRGVSIADASVMPTSPRANTMLASFAVGHRGADLIRAAVAAAPAGAADTAPASTPTPDPEPPAGSTPQGDRMTLLDPDRIASTLLAGTAAPATTTAEVREAATGAVLGSVATATPADLDAAVDRLVEGQRRWAATPQAERAAVLLRAADLLEQRADELAPWYVREAGCTMGYSYFQLQIGAQSLRAAAALTTEPVGELFPSAPGRLSMSRRVPVGVVGVIAPFNSPLYLALRSIGPALAVGNAVVVKPDPRTAITGGSVIAEVLLQAGLPEDALAVLPGDGALGAALVAHPKVPVIAFTGSTAAGRRIAVAAAEQMKRVHLELGGNSALVVFDDVDLDQAATAGAFGSFMHSGQICMASSRHLVHASIANEYAGRLAQKAEQLLVANPWQNPAAMVGPLIDATQRDAVHEIVTGTIAAGAEVSTGGTYDGLLYRPTVLTAVTPGMPAYDREIFGPVAPITAFETFEEAVELTNGTEYGLSVGVLTGDMSRGLAFADRVTSGNVHVNDQTLVDDVIQPFGGFGASGNGSRVGSARYNADAFTEQQWVTARPDIAPYPYYA
ncbi:aldehyde dehydrogenase family protein [Agromyces sp. SYSU T00194]|uniref:aldehyde dehydrogenase family protein n=1 Tax=Agromyces chitinivorans TaxID=3158560 RepID=UPI003397E1C3